jgi:hypothetical protein
MMALGMSATAIAQSAPGLQQLTTAISDNDVISLGVFHDLDKQIAAAEADRRAAMLIAVNRSVDFDLADGSWQPLNNGKQLWRLVLESPDAASISLQFSDFALAEDAQLWLYSPDGDSQQGPYGAEQANALGEFWSPIVQGDTVVLELETSQPQANNLVISTLGHGTKTWWREDGSISTKAAGSCHINVACSAGNGHSTKIRATARITYNTLAGGFVCSGTLLNNTAQDRRAFFLTANHCISNGLEALSATTYWQYQSNDCNSNVPANTNQTVSGATLRATWATNDFTLLELNGLPPERFNPYWSGWDLSTSNFGSGVTVHHPAGDVKKISIDTDPLSIRPGSSNPLDATNAAGRYVHVERWEVGTTEGGSSGSGIWNTSNHLVGQLSAGSADCNSPDGQDFYGWIGQAWAGGGNARSRLQDWLAPGNPNVVRLAGCDHYNENCGDSGDTGTPPAADDPAPSTPENSGGGGGGGSSLGLILLTLMLLRKRVALALTARI